MIERLPRLQRRILALGLLLLMMVVAVRLVVVPIVSTYLGNREAIVQMQDTITRYSRLSTQLDTLRLAVKELEEAEPESTGDAHTRVRLTTVRFQHGARVVSSGWGTSVSCSVRVPHVVVVAWAAPHPHAPPPRRPRSWRPRRPAPPRRSTWRDHPSRSEPSCCWRFRPPVARRIGCHPSIWPW